MGKSFVSSGSLLKKKGGICENSHFSLEEGVVPIEKYPLGFSRTFSAG
jgi:hypothetical protein